MAEEVDIAEPTSDESEETESSASDNDELTDQDSKASESTEKAKSASSDDDDSEEEQEEDKDLKDVLNKYKKVLEGKSDREVARFVSKHFWDSNNRAAASAKQLKALQKEHDNLMAQMKEYQEKAKEKAEPEKPEPPPEDIVRIEKHVEKLESRLKEKQARRDKVASDASERLVDVKVAERALKTADDVSKDRLTSEYKAAVAEYNSMVASWDSLNDVCETLVDDIDSRRDQLAKAKQYFIRERETQLNREREQKRLEDEVADAGAEQFRALTNKAIDEYGLLGEEAEEFFDLVKSRVMRATFEDERAGKLTSTPDDIVKHTEAVLARTIKTLKLDQAKKFSEASKQKATADRAMTTPQKASSQPEPPANTGPHDYRPQSYWDEQYAKQKAAIMRKFNP